MNRNDYEIFRDGKNRFVVMEASKAPSLEDLDDLAAKEFPGVPRKDLGVWGTPDLELWFGPLS